MSVGRRIFQFLDGAVVAALVMGPVSQYCVSQTGASWAFGLGVVWGVFLGLFVGMRSHVVTVAGVVLGLGLGAGVYWGPVDGMIVGFVVAIPVAMGFGLVALLLDWSPGAGFFCGLVVGVSAVLFVLLNGTMFSFWGGLAGCLVGSFVRVLLRYWFLKPPELSGKPDLTSG